MDVSQGSPILTVVEAPTEGAQLLETVVSLTGLPEELMYEELDQILKLKEQDTAELTLDGLRAAMLAYLETIQADLGVESEGEV